jgi:transcriptional regulator of acetoin/glycerol metabolism
MQPRQHEHIRAVMQVAGEGRVLPSESARDVVIRESWSRCVHQHRLDPTRMQEAADPAQSPAARAPGPDRGLLHIARHGLETLYQQVAGMGYVVLLTDARGVTVDFIGDLVLDPACAAPACTWAPTGASSAPAPAAWAPASAPARRSRCTWTTTSMPPTSR